MSRYLEYFRNRIHEGDLLKQQHIVVPIKTEGRSYGRISIGFQELYPDRILPVLDLKRAKTVDIGQGRTVTFICYWSEDSSYSSSHIRFCVTTSMRTFTNYMLENGKRYIEDLHLFLPIFKGLEKNRQIALEAEKEMQAVERTNDPFWRQVQYSYMIKNKSDVSYL